MKKPSASLAVSTLALAAVLAGCGSSSSAPTVTATAAPARVTLAAMSRGFIAWDNVPTKTLKDAGDGCDRLAIRDTEAKRFASKYFSALVVVSPSEACDASISIKENAMHIERNVWIEWPDGTPSETRTLVQASALAAYVSLG